MLEDSLLADWVYEHCGSVPFSSLEDPKFDSFLNKIGLPSMDQIDLAGERLNSKYKEARIESEARIHDAMFFQIASDGWKSGGFDNLVNLSVNLPNGSGVFRRAVFTSGYVFSRNVEYVLLETVREICGSNLQQCVRIVSDRLKINCFKES
ncbi:hypothetical protein Hanom_Chr12g01173331 [Helianthus anomalus]